MKSRSAIIETLPVIVETLPPWEKGGIGQAAAALTQANAGLMAMLRFGQIILHYQVETGMTIKALLEDCGCTNNYHTAARYVRIARAADALLIEGAELPDSATAILSAAKESDCERAEDLRAQVNAEPEDPALQEVWRKVLAGETPVGRWKAAYGGINKTRGDSHAKEAQYGKMGARACATLRTVWANWDYMPGADKGEFAEMLAHTLFGCPFKNWAGAPAAVLNEIMVEANRKKKGGSK